MSRARTQADPEAIDRTLDKASIEHYERLAAEADQHLDKLAAQAPLKDTTLEYQLRKRGVTRREFLKMTAVMTATMALPSMFDLRVARAAELATRLPVIWQELQSCTGNSMALIRNSNPGVDELILDLISLEYAEVLMAPSGQAAEDVLEASIEKYRGTYIAVFEGSVPMADDGNFLTIGPAGHTGIEVVKHVAENAAAVIAAGTCAAYGGIPAARPNPTAAIGIGDFLNTQRINKPVVNLPACPVSSTNVVGTILEYALFGRLPSLDAFGRPLWAYGDRIHDKCERRGHFDAGQFVEGWSDTEGSEGGPLPLQGRLQGADGLQQLRRRALQRRHLLADHGRPRLHRLQRARLLGHPHPVRGAPRRPSLPGLRRRRRRRHDRRGRPGRRGRRHRRPRGRDHGQERDRAAGRQEARSQEGAVSRGQTCD